MGGDAGSVWRGFCQLNGSDTLHGNTLIQGRRNMGEMGKIVEVADELTQPVVIGPEAYISAEYVQAERDKLWRKVWTDTGLIICAVAQASLMARCKRSSNR